MAVNGVLAKKQQLELLQSAEQACQAAKHAAAGCGPRSTPAADGDDALITELEALSHNFAGLHKLIENQEVSSELAPFVPRLPC